MAKFSFNAQARKEALSALRKLQLVATPAIAVVGQMLFTNLSDKVATAIASLVVFIVTSVLIVWVSGLTPEKASEKAARTKAKAEAEAQDTG